MRYPIKIKVWCKGTSANVNFCKPRWIDIDDFLLKRYYPGFQSTDISSITNCEDFEIVLYTGLLDKYQKEIYDGDIIEFDFEGKVQKGIVIYSQYRCGWSIVLSSKSGLTPGNKPNGVGLDYIVCKNYPLTVVGNIFENPLDSSDK